MTASSDSCFKVNIRWSILSAVADIVLSSANLKRSDNFNVESRSLRSILNNIGPSIDPCGTPDCNVRKSLKTLLKHC